jgi:hypothetical protein
MSIAAAARVGLKSMAVAAREGLKCMAVAAKEGLKSMAVAAKEGLKSMAVAARVRLRESVAAPGIRQFGTHLQGSASSTECYWQKRVHTLSWLDGWKYSVCTGSEYNGFAPTYAVFTGYQQGTQFQPPLTLT